MSMVYMNQTINNGWSYDVLAYIETELELAMVDKIKTVLLELGNGFSFRR